MLAKATARESQANFISVKSSDLLSKWYGESEQQIARLFARARQVAPTVIFIDELDSLVPARGAGMGEPQVTERVVNTILAEMDGLEELNNVVVIGATNRPNLIDPALLRPGRFDELIYVGVPDVAGRRRILAIHTQGMPIAKDVDLESLAERTERFTGADLEDLSRRAGLVARQNHKCCGGCAGASIAIDVEAMTEAKRAKVRGAAFFNRQAAHALTDGGPRRSTGGGASPSGRGPAAVPARAWPGPGGHRHLTLPSDLSCQPCQPGRPGGPRGSPGAGGANG